MDFIKSFEVELDKAVYISGEAVTGHVYLEVEDNMRMQNIKVLLRGKAHTEWKITRAGERRTMKQDEMYIDEKKIIWGREEDDSHQGVPILARGRHHYPFHFELPDNAIPCSFESKIGTIRYFVRVNINIPYASCPQSIRYFTVIGPSIDCMDEKYLIPVHSTAKRNSCSLCCGKGPMLLRASMDRTSYVCGEQIKLKAEIQNGSDSEVWVVCKLVQYVEFYINKGVLGLSKDVRHVVLEVESEKVPAHETSRLDELMSRLVVPVMPPSLIEECSLVQIYYMLKLCLETSKGKGDTPEINFPITIGTVPFLTQNGCPTEIHYETAASNVEGGMYISTEYQLGQVYMGDEADPEADQIVLYRPVYVCMNRERASSRSDAHLLQVPSRQCTRSRENLKGSREALYSQENVSPTQALPTSAEGAKAGKPQAEDKFLQEITSKIANRQVGCLDAESKTEMGKQTPNQSDIDSQVDIMRKQKKSNDFVHQALVSELRRHLSSDSEEPNGQSMKPQLKKVTCLKKVSESSTRTEQGKRLRTETKTQEETVVTTMSMDTNVFPVTDIENSVSKIQEFDIEIEANESTALLSDDGRQDYSMKSENQVTDAITSESVAFVETSMQEPEDTPSLSKPSTSAHLSGSLQTEDLVVTSETGSSVDAINRVQRSSDSAIVSESQSSKTEEEYPPPETKPCSPKVAPKPKQKDRHSFPASQFRLPDSAGGVSEEITRPKSEYVELLRETSGENMRPKSEYVELSRETSVEITRPKSESVELANKFNTDDSNA